MRGIGYTIFSNFFTALTLFFTLLLKRSIPGIRSSVHHVSLASIHALVDSNIHLGFVRKTHDPIAPSSSPISLSSNPFGGFGPHDLIDFSGILSDRLEPTSPSDSTNPPSTSPSFSFSGGLTNAFCISGPLAGDDWSANFTAATTAVGTQFSDLFTRMHSMAEILRRVVQAEITAMHGERNETYVGYEPLVARMLAAFAQLSYCDLSRLNRLVANPMDGVDFSHLSFVRSWEWSEAGMGAYVALEQLHDQVHHRLVLAFRGSENFQNWFTNLNVFFTTLEACDGCRVHAGFQNMWDQIRKDVIGALNDILDEENIREFLITGHSLGGAIAVLASLDLVHMWDRKAKPRSGFRVYTFGQPVWATCLSRDIVRRNCQAVLFASQGKEIQLFDSLGNHWVTTTLRMRYTTTALANVTKATIFSVTKRRKKGSD